uniref:Adipogenin n=1 Tax=Cyanistes caeruleus TaxID=156563 RepID=A0A8C0UC89_CYACU
MRYPLVPLVNELTFPLLFFWFCLPFVMLLIIAIIWLQLLLNEGKDARGVTVQWNCGKTEAQTCLSELKSKKPKAKSCCDLEQLLPEAEDKIFPY